MLDTKYDYLKDETLQNIQILLEEKDNIISDLQEACKEARKGLTGLKNADGLTFGIDSDITLVRDILIRVIKQTESK